MNAPPPGSSRSDGVGQLPGQRVQHDVHAGAAGRGQERRLEPGVPRRRDVSLVQAHRGQGGVLAGARGGVDLQAQVPGDSHRGHADPAGRRVHQELLPGADPGQVDQRMPGRGERRRYRRGLRERPAAGDRHEQPRVGHRDRAERAGRQAEHAVPGRQAGHAGAGVQHHPRDVAAQHPGAGLGSGDHAQRDHHVAEVQPGRADGDSHLPGPGQVGQRGAGRKGQAVQRAGPGGLQPPRPPTARRYQPGRRVNQAPRVRRPAPDHQLRLPRGQRPRQQCLRLPGRRLARGQVRQDQAVRVLRLHGPDQAPHRRPGQVGHALPGRHGHRAPGLHHQPRPGRTIPGQPLLHDPQHPGRLGPGRPAPDPAPAQARTISGPGSSPGTAAVRLGHRGPGPIPS